MMKCGISACKSGSKDLVKSTTNVALFFQVKPLLVCKDCSNKADDFMEKAKQDVQQGKIDFIRKIPPRHSFVENAMKRKRQPSPDPEVLLEIDEAEVDRTVKKMMKQGKVFENLQKETQQLLAEVAKQKKEYDELDGNLDALGREIHNIQDILKRYGGGATATETAVVVAEVDLNP